MKPIDPISTDGRRRRSKQSRERIVQALLALVREGRANPGAEEVAERAGVGIRSVFRHFRDMETLYREMGVHLAGQYAEIATPFTASTWRGRLGEMIDRRSRAYERLAPFKRAADARRLESPTLQEDSARLEAVLRERLRAVLPAAASADRSLFAQLELALSVDAWMRLRDVQGLSPDEARAAVEAMTEALLARFPDGPA